MNVLLQTLSAEKSPMTADVLQLQGLCERMDEEAFLPFTQEDYGIENAKKILNYYQIVNKVADKLIHEMGASTKGVRATPQFGGFSRYLKLGGFGISIRFSCDHWIKFAETPFWFTIKEDKGDWVYAVNAREKLISYENCAPKRLFINEISQELLIPLYAPAYSYEDEVLNNMFWKTRGRFYCFPKISQKSFH